MDGSNAAYAAHTLGEIAATLPGATAVFRRHKLDFCCGGRATLAEAAEQQGVDAAAVTAELAALEPGANRTLPAAPEALIEHIVARYHNVHRRELPELRRLAETVEKVHAGHPAVPAGLSAILGRMTEELEVHMQKEEQVLFPMMRRGGNPMIVHPIGMMRREHDDHGATLRRLSALTDDFQPPTEACGTWQALYKGLQKLTDDLMEHIHIENNILFPRFGG